MTAVSELVATAARVDITPSGTWTLGGYGARTGASTGVHAALEANVLVLEHPATAASVAWVCLDVLAIPTELRRAVVTAVRTVLALPEDRVIVVGSHTHSAPDAWIGTIHPGLPAHYDSGEVERVSRSIADALRHAVPARSASLSWGTSTVTGVGASRHDAGASADTPIGVLTVRSPGISALVVDYACHATVLGSGSSVISPDWVGAARTELRRRFGSDLPVLYLPGSAGDISTRFTRRDQTPAEADRLGRIVGVAAGAAIDDASPLAGSGIDVHRHRFDARVRTSFADVEGERGGEERELAPGGDDRIARSRSEGRRSRAALEAAALPPTVAIETTTVRLGDRRWLHTPFEMSSALDRQITADDPRVRHVGYTDGYAGYLVDGATASEGQYEALASYFDLAETRRIVDELRTALE